MTTKTKVRKHSRRNPHDEDIQAQNWLYNYKNSMIKHGGNKELFSSDVRHLIDNHKKLSNLLSKMSYSGTLDEKLQSYYQT
jgi:hypothetical protein